MRPTFRIDENRKRTGGAIATMSDTDILLIVPPKRFAMICCDCNLVHDVKFTRAKQGFHFRAIRNDRRTAARRRECKRRKK